MSAPLRLQGPEWEIVRFACRHGKNSSIWLEFFPAQTPVLPSTTEQRSAADVRDDVVPGQSAAFLFRIIDITVGEDPSAGLQYGFLAVIRDTGQKFQAVLDRANGCGAYAVTFLDGQAG
jgi:hypothetical protein